ncbi:MarR family transcriptional regulator [Paenibacillus sp. BK033]|uniref:MarR family winged helix-turn-helix transcriptional regulator n=1 Tax=unclassified Paenibacillus TaxID=185978 RepID=UPI0010483749|nr:MarR family transcriptional regulator [Paenibacillus sp. BK033]NIK69698.1 DNA-binding MarR family transcriptional regulator [Paenibacillus sp. BK720]TCM95872.1 MarR family transcriptional regulator [Paenibacillus sp. BK033]
MEEQRIVGIFQTYREINQVFFQILSKAASKHNLTALQLLVLRILHETPEIRMSELAEKLNVGNSTMSGIVDRMVKAGILERERTEADRRAMTMKLTEKGKELWRETDATRMNMLRPLLSMTEQDHRELGRLQNEVLRLLKQSKEEA